MGVPSGDVAVLSAAVEVALSGHLPAGGEVARGIAVSRAATAVEAEGSGLLSRLQALGQYRVDPLAMGSGIPRLVKRGTVAERVAAIEGRVAVGDATVRTERILRSAAPLDAPTLPQARAVAVTEAFSGELVKAETILRDGAYGSRTACVQFKLGETPILQVPYCDRGFPIFDAVRKFEVRLPQSVWMNENGRVHMRAATVELRSAMETGTVTESHLADWIKENYALRGETLSAGELVTKTAGKVAELIRRVDRTVMGSGIPRLVKRGTVADRVAAIEGRVSVGDATLRPENVATHQLHLKELRTADIETRVKLLLDKPGRVIAGGTHSKPLRTADRIAKEYGGDAKDWVKMSSNGTVDGIEFHWVENVRTGQRVELKNIIDEGYLPRLLKKKEGKHE